MIEDENWDFDFSLYEQDEKEEGEAIESIHKADRPAVTGLRSRFSLGETELERIADLKRLSTKYSIQIETRTQEIGILWKLYGILSELWEIIRNIYGTQLNQEISEIKIRCRQLIETLDTTQQIPTKIHNNLLYFRSQIYKIMQLSNLGFEVERTARSNYSRAKRVITE